MKKKTTHIRLWVSTKERLEKLRRLLTLKKNGEPVTLVETLDIIISKYERENN